MIAASVTVPVVMTCAGRPWQWVLAGCGAAAIFYTLLYSILRQTDTATGLTPAVKEALGPVAGGLALFLGGAWALLAAADTAGRCVSAFPAGEADRLAPAAILLLTALALRSGSLTAARCAGVLAPVLWVLYAGLLLAAAPDLNLSWCRPWGRWQQGTGVLAALLFPSAALFLPRERAKREKAPVRLLAALTAVPALFALATAGCLSPQLVSREPFAFYTLTQSVSVLGVMERFEPVLSASLYLGFFCLVSLLLASAQAQICAAIPVLEGKHWFGPLLCAAAFGLSLVTKALPEVVRQVAAAVFWGVVPVFVLLIVAIKKVRKKEKKGVDKRGEVW